MKSLYDDTPSVPRAKTNSKPAPKKDQIRGSSKNKEGSASEANDKIEAGKSIELFIKEARKNYPAFFSEGGTTGMLKAVARRGAGAFSSSHSPGATRTSWSISRMKAFMKLLISGTPSNPAYKQDNDLLPSNHPKSTKNKKDE